MQVGLKANTLQPSAVPLRTAPGAPQTVERVAETTAPANRNAFPEAALLSRRPMRYNVQLNQQLTSVQKADDYLAHTETRLLQLRQSVKQGDLTRQSNALQKHLAQRAQLSGGTVDRHFSAQVQQKSQVNFTLPGCEKILSNPGGETLLFAIGGRQRELAAVTLPQEATARQTLTTLNTGLGRLGIHARQTTNGQLMFTTDESRWSSVSQHLAVCGEGNNFAADAFTALSPQAEDASSDEMMNIPVRRDRDSQLKLQKTLNHITTQRSQLRHQQDKVAIRIDEMATTLTRTQALDTSKALNAALGKSTGSYSTLSQAMGAQANLRLATVKNLLG